MPPKRQTMDPTFITPIPVAAAAEITQTATETTPGGPVVIDLTKEPKSSTRTLSAVTEQEADSDRTPTELPEQEMCSGRTQSYIPAP